MKEIKHISVHSFKEVVEAEENNPSVDFINVCTPAEYKEKHIKGVRSVPLDEIQNRVGEFTGKTTIYVHCRSGNRSQQAIKKLAELGLTADLVNVEGGLLSWDEAGFATNKLTNRLPLMRQVMVVAGSLILLGYILSLFNHNFIWLSVFVGAGLTFAGLTGWCGMSFLLAKMPWNK
ncbi:MAG: rhodanese-like domain-containing protein [Candidatus Paceibacterota bacterium]